MAVRLSSGVRTQVSALSGSDDNPVGIGPSLDGKRFTSFEVDFYLDP